MVVNGVNVTALLGFEGQPTNRQVSYNGLMPNAAYGAALTVSNALGVASAMISFDTSAPDVTPPTVQSVDPAQGATIGSLTQITVVFNEPVRDVGASDLLVDTRPSVGVTGSGNTYTFDIEQPPYGTLPISWEDATDTTDLAGNTFDVNGPGATWVYHLVDNVAPAVVTTVPPPGNTIRGLTQIEITFNEPVTGLEASDLLLQQTPAFAVTGSLQGPYVFQFNAAPAGPAQLAWAAAHGIQDQAGNNFAGGNWSYLVDPEFVEAKVRINEFLSATLNPNGLSDEFGSLEDWIELHNYGPVPVNLNGFSLTDAPGQPGKWIFPDVTLPAGTSIIRSCYT